MYDFDIDFQFRAPKVVHDGPGLPLMPITSHSSSRIFSKVVFMLVLRYIYYPIPFVSQIHFVMLGDICSHLWYIPPYIIFAA